jgi:hypothetical protein
MRVMCIGESYPCDGIKEYPGRTPLVGKSYTVEYRQWRESTNSWLYFLKGCDNLYPEKYFMPLSEGRNNIIQIIFAILFRRKKDKTFRTKSSDTIYHFPHRK